MAIGVPGPKSKPLLANSIWSSVISRPSIISILILVIVTTSITLLASPKNLQKYSNYGLGLKYNFPAFVFTTVNASEQQQQNVTVNESMVSESSILSLCPDFNETACKIDKENPCTLLPYVHSNHYIYGLISAVNESNMDVSSLTSFCLHGRTVVLSNDRNTTTNTGRSNSLVQTMCHRSIESAIYKLLTHYPSIVLPGWGAHWPGKKRSSKWYSYSTGVLASGSPVCFWPSLPNLDETETDISIWTSQQYDSSQHEQDVQGIPRYKKVMMSGGFLDNFWHGVALLNVWCKMRHDEDMHFLVQFKDDPQPFLYHWASAMGISSDRVVLHDRPIVADEVFAAHYHDSDVDWSCLHGILHLPPESRRDTEKEQQHALIYFRKGRGIQRDIPEAIHVDFSKLLEERIPGLVVKTFYGSETLEEAKELFSNAKIVIGPHGAGLANLVFCAELIPVVEFVTPAMFRMWLMYGGHSFNLPWWPVLINSFDSRDQIMNAVSVVESALNQAAR